MSGRRLALVVGIDTYSGFGPESQLAGAIRDARVMAETLIAHHSFAPRHVTRLFEAQATRAGILGALEALRRRARAGDQVVFFFSGHGSQMTDREGDEGDGLDETLVPYDSGRGEDENRDVSDDEIHYWAAGVLEVTPHLTMIFDCCHSATLQRPFQRVRSVPPDLRPVDALPPSPVPVWRDVDVGPRPLVLAACRDDERAFELPPSVAGKIRGALSFHLDQALRHTAPEATWRELFEKTAAAVAAERLDQHPHFSGDGLDAPVFGGVRAIHRAVDVDPRLLDLAAGPNRYQLSMKLFRSGGGAWRPAAAGSFVEGERLSVDLSHGHDRGVFVYLFDVGVTGAVTLLFPDLDGHEILDPGRVLSFGVRRGDPLELSLPDDFDESRSEGVGHLVLIGAESRWSTSRLLAGSVGDLPDSAFAVTQPYRLRRA